MGGGESERLATAERQGDDMAGYHLVDERHGAASAVPDVLAMDDVAVGTGASIVVAVAATIALILAMVVATLSSALPASAAPGLAGAGPAIVRSADDAGVALYPATVAYRITDVAPARDGTFAVLAAAPGTEDSLAPVVVAGLLLATLAATASAWRGMAARTGAPVRTRRPAPASKPARGR
jgi:hypothetical protein